MSVADVFTGRACPSCGWHESSRHAGAASCFVCLAPMATDGHTYDVAACAACHPHPEHGGPCELRARVPSITRPASAWDEPGPFCETCEAENLPGAHRCQVCGGRCKRPAA